MSNDMKALLSVLFLIALGFVFGFMFGNIRGWNRYYDEQKTQECKYKKVNNEKFIPSYCYDYLK